MTKTEGAFYTGNYRNLFKEYGYAEAEINAKVEKTWHDLFYGDEETRIYYPAGDDAGYILDTWHLDVRTEGMSYGMMFCVQMDKKEEFDRIWTWAKRYMEIKEGRHAGYFAWSLNPDGTPRSQGPAPDGEEYFAMALFFASHRWGDGSEPYDYGRQARELLRICVHKGEDGSEGRPMWDPETKLIRFVPDFDFTDPSYHLPHFYELFSLWAYPEDREFWAEAAKASREYLKKACHPVTGLAPEYANYDGTPNFYNGHGNFSSDSFRVAGNVALDYEWFRADDWAREEANKIQAFFAERGVTPNCSTYTIDGTPLTKRDFYSPGLLAMNAMASLAADGSHVKTFIDAFWREPLCTGPRRYYDNCLYFFSLLALSGRYRIWKP